jgi:hypothetical protein
MGMRTFCSIVLTVVDESRSWERLELDSQWYGQISISDPASSDEKGSRRDVERSGAGAPEEVRV